MPKEISHCSSVPPCDRKDAMQSTSGSCPHACGLDGAVLGSWCLSAQHPACFFSCDWQQDVKIDHLPPGALGIQCMWVLLGCGRGVSCSGNRAGALKENATLEWGLALEPWGRLTLLELLALLQHHSGRWRDVRPQSITCPGLELAVKTSHILPGSACCLWHACGHIATLPCPSTAPSLQSSVDTLIYVQHLDGDECWRRAQA